MSTLSGRDKRQLEKLFDMSSGYVMSFTNRTFSEFFSEYNVVIYDDRYGTFGGSKANRLRALWESETNWLVAQVIEGLIGYGQDANDFQNTPPELIDGCMAIAERLRSENSVVELDALTALGEDPDFEILAQHVRDAIQRDQPEGGLDRLHTYVTKYVRTLCQEHGLEFDREKPLHSLFGEYVRFLERDGQLETRMTKHILKVSISVLEAFNEVRNNRSLAHDNPILNHEESLLIYNHVAATIRFIKFLEQGSVNGEEVDLDTGLWDLPF